MHQESLGEKGNMVSVRKNEFGLATGSARKINSLYLSFRFVSQAETKTIPKAAPTHPALGRYQLHRCVLLNPVWFNVMLLVYNSQEWTKEVGEQKIA